MASAKAPIPYGFGQPAYAAGLAISLFNNLYGSKWLLVFIKC